ncbi:MAG: GNAT family N-acetyltransferase [Acidimicrobiia bacterium]
MEVRRLGPTDAEEVVGAGHLFDRDPDPAWTRDFLSRDGHHLLLAYEDGDPVGFISGVELAHPDKGVEMLLYELGVDEPFRRRGIGRALIGALADLGRERRCRSMWVPIEGGDDVAAAVYRSAGAGPVEAAGILLWDLG